MVLLIIIPGASAFSLSAATVNPTVLNPGDPVNVTCTVYVASGTPFSSYDDLQTVTALDDPVWTYTVIVNEVENTRPGERGKMLTISGYELSYRKQDQVIVKYALTGKIPSDTPAGSNLSLIKLQELDAKSNVISSSVVEFTHLVGQPTPTPTPGYGTINVVSEPAGANIFVDNTIRGVSPTTIKAVPNGPHTVLLRLDGYEDYSRTVTVMADDQQVDATLIQKTGQPTVTAKTTSPVPDTTVSGTGTQQPVNPSGTGSLSLSTSPAGAQVYIDGKMRGITPATIPGLTPGAHTVRLILDGYLDLETTTDITTGTTSEFVTGLSKRKQLPGFTGLVALSAIGILLVARQIRKRKS
jgi:hypothetical protein